MDKVFVAQSVANKLFATELAIDQALTEASQLVAELVQARQTLGASAVLGNEALLKATLAVSTLSEARSAVVAAHNELAAVKNQLRIRTKMGGFADKTDASFIRDETSSRNVSSF